MFDYLQQFNSLSKDLRDRVSSSSAMTRISELETKYKVDLAIVIMKLMVKSLKFVDLPAYLAGELFLSPDAIDKLIRDLKEKIFAPLADYLGLTSEIRAFDLDKDIEEIIKEAGLSLPSAVAVNRFKNIISTYSRGVRSKIDTRNTLAKDVKIGGLNLSPEEIDRVLKIADTRVAKGASAAPVISSPSVSAPATRLDKIVSGADKNAVPVAAEYNLKEALAKGEIKTVVKEENKSMVGSGSAPVIPAALDVRHELSGPEAQLDLPQPAIAAKASVIPKVVPAPVIPVIPKVVPAPVIPVVPKVAPKAASVPISPAAARNLAGRQAPAPSAARPAMHDIKPMPKVMGPIEELQFLDVVNFRRLGAAPAEATAKVFTKIKLLEKDGYDKMVAGVRAWRQSPVNRMYLRLGQEAIAKGMPIREMIEARKKSAQEYLSMDEIEAIVGLNGKLVF